MREATKPKSRLASTTESTRKMKGLGFPRVPRIPRGFFLLCFIIHLQSFITALPVFAQTSETLTLDQAITQALQHNRLIQNEELEVQKAAARTLNAQTFKLPQFEVNALAFQPLTPLDFRFKQGALGTLPTGLPFPARNTEISSSFAPKAVIGLRATQPLTQLRRINLNVKLQEINEQLAQNKLAAQRRQITNQVKRAYYAMLQTQSARSALGESLKLHRELDRVVGEYVAQQVLLTAESLDVKTQLANDEYEATRLDNALATQQEQLNQLMGRDLRASFVAAPVLEPASLDFDLAVAQNCALEQRTELREARLRQQQATLARKLKQAERLPEVGLTAGYFPLLGFEFLPRQVGLVGVAVKWEPFDWGRKRRELHETEKNLAQTDNVLREAETQVLLDVNARYRKLQEARALLRVGQASQTASTEKLRVALNKFKQEAALMKDVLQTQAAVAEANHQYQQALFAFLTARADFEKALGAQ